MLEGSVAAAAGLGMVYSVPSLRMQHGLTRFLERLAAQAADRGPVGGGCFRGVPLCVVPEQARASQHRGSRRMTGQRAAGLHACNGICAAVAGVKLLLGLVGFNWQLPCWRCSVVLSQQG